MAFTEETLKKLKDAVRSVEEKAEGKEEQVAEVKSTAGKLLLHSVAHRLISNKLAECTAKKTVGGALGQAFFQVLHLSSLTDRLSMMQDLAEAIDNLLDDENTAEETPVEEPVEDVVEEEPAEEPVEDVAEEEPETVEETEETAEEPVEETVTEEVVEESTEENETDGEDGDEESEDEEEEIPQDVALEFIDVMEQPERYAEMQENERQGQVRLVSRYRRSFLSKLCQSRGTVQSSYSAIKNAFLSYKGVKSRVSWGYEAFNKGRVKLAKVIAKSATLYLYLALDPTEIEGTKYGFKDMSAKKKYALTPVLMKIKGERKLKYALELIEKLCREKNELPNAKNFEEVDYTMPEQTTEELVQAGLIKQFTAEIPVGANENGVNSDEAIAQSETVEGENAEPTAEN